MKYMQNGGFQSHPLMRLTLGCTLVLLAGFVVSNFYLYFQRMDLSPASVVAYYNGSEEEFRPPRSAQSMLEVTHAHTVMMAVVLLLLTHLAIFARVPEKGRIAVIVVPFAAALLSEGSPWMIRFVHPDFAILKVLGFSLLQTSLLFLLGLITWTLLGHRPENDHSHAGPEHQAQGNRTVATYAGGDNHRGTVGQKGPARQREAGGRVRGRKP
jgi:hypothetical protein